MKDIQKKYLFIIIIMIQILFTLIGFKNYFSDPKHFVFQPGYDGQHSNFTFISHLMQDKSEGIWKLNQQNYPYGDYVFYQDNPLTFTLPIKIINDYVMDLRPYQFATYNFFHVISVLLATIFLFLIHKRYVTNQWFLGIGSIALAWINPQILRLHVGHYSLAYSWVILGAIYILIRLIEDEKESWKWYVYLVFWTIIGSFCHFYYLALLAAILLPTKFVYDCLKYPNLLDKASIIGILKSTLKMASVFLLAYLFIYFLIRHFDGYIDLRDSASSGYGWTPWKYNFAYVFSAYGFIKVPFFLRQTENSYYESYAYLGTFALFLFFIVAARRILFGKKIFAELTIFDNKNRMLWFGILIAAIISFFISLGDDYSLNNGTYTMQNYLNPIRYLRKISDMFTQFRCLGRFIWVWWWPLSIFAIILADRIVTQSKYTVLKYLVFGISILMITDVKDFMSNFRGSNTKDTILEADRHKDYLTRFKDVDLAKFQCILPLPFYHVGVSDMNYTVDGDRDLCIEMNSISHATKLPLMSMQNARSIRAHNKALFSIFLKEEVDPSLVAALNDKPILVIYRKASFDQNGRAIHTEFNGIERRPAYDVAYYGQYITEKYEMTKLMEDDKFIAYSWDIKHHNKINANIPQFPKIAIEDFSKMMHDNQDWYHNITTKAQGQGISADSALYNEAVYLLKNY